MKPTKTRIKQRLEAERRAEEVARQWGMDALSSERLAELLTSEEPNLGGVAAGRLIGRGKAAIDPLLAGMTHADGKMRAVCALLLDHVADNRCIGPLLRAIRHDPHEAVRRCAMHSLVCDDCKESPLEADVVDALLEAALKDRSKEVRRRAVFYLSQQPYDPRIAPALEALLAGETDAILRRRAEGALLRHRPEDACG